MVEEDLCNRFSFHPADTQKKQELHGEVRNQCYVLAVRLNDLLLECREKSLAITKLEEVMFWANASIAREPIEVPTGKHTHEQDET